MQIIYDIETNANPGNSLYSKPSDTIYSYTGGSINITSTEPIQTGGYTFVGWCRTNNSTSDIPLQKKYGVVESFSSH